MSLKRKILVLVIGIVFSLALFGRFLDLEYRSLIASTQSAPALLDENTLENYGSQLNDFLNDNNVEMAIVSRAGQARKRLPPGVQYTHGAFFVRGENGGYDVYNLYHGEENRLISSLVRDKPADFLKPTRAHDVGILIPTPAFQSSMKAHITSDDYGHVHNAAYSLISNPFDLGYQNCNEFLLDELAAFSWDVNDRSELKKKLGKAIVPTKIKAGFVRRYIAPLVDERLIMKDHGKIIQTTTRLDLEEFLQSENVLDTAYILEFKPAGK